MYRRIRELREDRDLTQEKVAQILHVSQSNYSRYENGYLDVPSGVLMLAFFAKIRYNKGKGSLTT